MSIPEKFTGWAVFEAQGGKEKCGLKEYSYTPREFEEDDVIVKVLACGICGSDVHSLDGDESSGAPTGHWPMICGHEVVGEVVKAGSQSGHKDGDRVGIGGQAISCGKCAACESHFENYCPKMGFSYDTPLDSDVQKRTMGGFSDYMIAKGKFAIDIPDGLDIAATAPLLCAGVTMFSPMKHYKVGPGSKVGIVGVGGLGHLGIQFAKALGAEAIAISSSASKQSDAEKLGADGYIDASKPKEALEMYTGYFDIILSSSYQPDMPLQELYLPMIKLFGQMIILGLPPDGYPKLGTMELLGKNIGSTLIGSPQDQKDMLELAAKKGVKTWVEERPMKDINKALDDFKSKGARYRFVLVN